MNTLGDLGAVWGAVLLFVVAVVVALLALRWLVRLLLEPRTLRFVPGRMMRGEDVGALQLGMRSLGVRADGVGPGCGRPPWVDQIYGQQTEACVRSFQFHIGLEPTGVADRETRKAVIAALRARESQLAALAASGEIRLVSPAAKDAARKAIDRSQQQALEVTARTLVGDGEPCTHCGCPFYSQAGHTVCFGCRGELAVLEAEAKPPPKGAA